MPRGRTGRKGGHDGTLFTNRAAQVRVFRDFPSVFQGDVQEAAGDPLQLFEQRRALARRARHVGEHLELADAVVAAQHFDQRVGVGHRRRLVAHDQQHMLRGLRELHHAVRDAGGRVDDQRIDAGAQGAERLHQAEVTRRGQVRELGDARSARHDLNAMRRFENDFFQRALARQHVRHRVTRRQAEEHVDVREAEIAVEQHDAAARRRQRRREVHRHAGLADAALAAGDRDHLHRPGIARRAADRSIEWIP